MSFDRPGVCLSEDLQASEIKAGTKKKREIVRMGRNIDKQELNSEKKSENHFERLSLMHIWKCYIIMQMSFVYPANSSFNSILFTNANGQVGFCFCESQRE